MKIAKVLLYILYAAIVTSAGVYSFYRPANNWDILPYVASAYSLESTDTNRIHKETYELIKNRVDSATYAQLTTGDYRLAMATCAKCFMEQLPFYKIKALYVISVYLLYKSGVNVYQAPFIISCISYLLVNVICFFWIRLIFKEWSFSIIISIAFALFPFMLNSAIDAAPNMFSAFFVLLAMFFIVIKKQYYFFLILMFPALATRPDNIFFFALILAVLFYSEEERINIKKSVLAVSLIAGIIIFKLTDLWAANYSWKILFEHGFSRRIYLPAEYDSAFNIWMYFKAFFKWPVMLKVSGFFVQLLIFTITLYILKADKTKNLKMNFDLLILLAAGLSIVVHYMLYPVFEDNHFIAQYIIIDLIFIKNISEKFRPAAIED